MSLRVRQIVTYREIGGFRRHLPPPPVILAMSSRIPLWGSHVFFQSASAGTSVAFSMFTQRS